MHAAYHFNDHPLTRKLESIFTLTDDERQALSSLPMQVMATKRGQDIVHEGDRPSRSCLFLEGIGCTYKVTPEGKRQIVAFNIPGSIPDLHSFHLQTLDASVAALDPCKVAFIPHEVLQDLCERHPRIMAAFWRKSLVDAAVYREWVVNIGQREAYKRMAHLLCEMMIRLNAVGLASDHSCDLPITQTELGDALGITTVHVNRVLQKMRAEGLIQTKGTALTIPDWYRLQEAGEFDPDYLHLGHNKAAA
ncbi:Crp/Fnr family transcriptional regulator [Microvirga makkahensis]|uniref:Helix-turn-helix domain-containing protein n=1 Tax=Microvirga makkahensis TaxID=1128670 RepID=A0A7X3MSA7_9HYPH|nr:Crp/Fnr family transcriptional regulator [Microvirga makkahensis]MXQ12312.1 helix-turn-helix domain-containing protein [Microvirga makkahensis]